MYICICIFNKSLSDSINLHMGNFFIQKLSIFYKKESVLCEIDDIREKIIFAVTLTLLYLIR